jgi:TAP-like protein
VADPSRAYLGDWQPIANGILESTRGLRAALSVGVFFSITCNEDVAFMREEDIERETRGTFLADYRVCQQQAASTHWPRASLPEDYRAPVRSAVPTLFVSGDTDAATPLWLTEHVAGGFSIRTEVVLRGRGPHGVEQLSGWHLRAICAQRRGAWARCLIVQADAAAVI